MVTASGLIVAVLAATPTVTMSLALKCINAGLQRLDLRCIALVSLLASPFGGLSNERWIAFDVSQCVIDVNQDPFVHVLRLDQVAVCPVGVQSRPTGSP